GAITTPSIVRGETKLGESIAETPPVNALEREVFTMRTEGKTTSLWIKPSITQVKKGFLGRKTAPTRQSAIVLTTAEGEAPSDAFLYFMYPVIRIVLLIILALVSSASTALSQQASASPAKSTPAPTPIPLAKVPMEAQSTLASLQEIEANVSREQSSVEAVGRTLSELTNEIDARVAEDRRLLTSAPTLEVLFPLKLAWQSLGVRLSASARELAQHATSLEEQLGRLDKLDKTWQATLQSAKQPETPPPVLQSVQSVVDSVARTRQATESGQARVFVLQSRISEQEARVRTALSLIEQGENRALKGLFVRDSPPIWSVETSLGTEWKQHSGESFTLQLST